MISPGVGPLDAFHESSSSSTQYVYYVSRLCIGRSGRAYVLRSRQVHFAIPTWRRGLSGVELSTSSLPCGGRNLRGEARHWAWVGASQAQPVDSTSTRTLGTLTTQRAHLRQPPLQTTIAPALQATHLVARQPTAPASPRSTTNNRQPLDSSSRGQVKSCSPALHCRRT